MSKEMFISSSFHETKLAVVEDDQLVEVYFERDTDVGLVGGIYKGRVSRVLPGMQSAFVDIGLDRDAFLYVSDFFFEDQDDYDKILEEAEASAVGFSAEPAQAAPAAAPPAEAVNPEATHQETAPVPAISQIPTGEAPAQAPPESQAVETSTPEPAVTPAAGATPAPRERRMSRVISSRAVAAGGIGGESLASIAKQSTSSSRGRRVLLRPRSTFCLENP